MAIADPMIIEPLLVPSGKFEAPRDSDIFYRKLSVDGEIFETPLIKQLFAGNCAEYASTNLALLATSFDFDIGEEFSIFLKQQPNLRTAINSLETGYVLHMLDYIQSLKENGNNAYGLKISDTAEENILAKRQNLYEDLEGTNAVALFWIMMNGLNAENISNHFHTNVQSCIDDLNSSPNQAIFIGDTIGAHATALFSYKNRYFFIDSMNSEQELIKMLNSQEVSQKVSNVINSGGYFVVSKLTQ